MTRSAALILGCFPIAAVAAFSFAPMRKINEMSFASRNNINIIMNNRRMDATIRSSSLSSSTSLFSSAGGGNDDNANLNKAPTFNGQVIFPIKAVMAGLKGHQVAAVYAILGRSHKRGQDGWTNCQHISITKDLYSDLSALLSESESENVAHVRALSFAYPQKSAMTEVADRWRGYVADAGAVVEWDSNSDIDAAAAARDKEQADKEKLVQLMMATATYEEDEDDDDDEFEFDDDDDVLSSDDVMSAMGVSASSEASSPLEAKELVSPFEEGETSSESASSSESSSESKLEFNPENVNKVLDEVRPYLISDGGNVSVKSVDPETRNVYLVLEGACGTCASSTVTMQMGIERVLKENFDGLGEVIQVEDVDPEGEGGVSGGSSSGLTMESVMGEVNRIGPAITAMGGVVEIMSVDPLGVVEVKFRGSTKVQQGLELALLDVPYVKHVKFVN